MPFFYHCAGRLEGQRAEGEVMLCCALLAEPVENNQESKRWSQGFKNRYAKNQLRPDQVPVEVSQHDKLQVDEIGEGKIILYEQVELTAPRHCTISEINRQLWLMQIFIRD